MASLILIAAPGGSVTFPLNDISRLIWQTASIAGVILRKICDTNRTVGLLNFNLGVWGPSNFQWGYRWTTQESGSLAMLLAKRRASSEGAPHPNAKHSN